MRISTQNMIISIAAGALTFGISVPMIQIGAFFVAPAVTAILWAHFSKKEAADRLAKEQRDS